MEEKQMSMLQNSIYKKLGYRLDELLDKSIEVQGELSDEEYKEYNELREILYTIHLQLFKDDPIGFNYPVR